MGDFPYIVRDLEQGQAESPESISFDTMLSSGQSFIFLEYLKIRWGQGYSMSSSMSLRSPLQ